MINHSYSKIYDHFIWTTQNRDLLIKSCFKKQLYNYIGRIVMHNGWVLVAIGGVQDHVHILIQAASRDYIPDIVCKIHSNSSRYISKYFSPNFLWQEGYGVFTVDQIYLDRVKNYILRQEEHHKI